MNQRAALFLVTVCILMHGLGNASYGAFHVEKWSMFAPLDFKEAQGKGPCTVALTPEVFDVALPDLLDLRIIAGATTEIGYALRTATGASHKTPIPVTLLNRSHIKGEKTSVTVDFGVPIIKNRVVIETPGRNFRRKATIEASDDGQNWAVAREGAFLFRARLEGGKGDFVKNEVEFPDNNQRYLRIIVYNDPEDAEALEIEAVKAWRLSVTPPETAAVPLLSEKVEQKGKNTEIFLDLGFKNMPVREIALVISDTNFHRSVELFGRNSEKHKVTRRVEDAPTLDKEVETPWTTVLTGTVYRFSMEAGLEESVTLLVGNAKYRFFKLIIRNGDNPSLGFTGARVARLVQYADFMHAGPEDQAVFVGNPKASRPEYDVGRYIDKLRADGAQTVALGMLRPNPAFGEKKRELPWSERHGVVLWAALLLIGAVLAFLIHRTARAAPKGEPGE